jgi:predicted Zn-dependent peptidase
MIDKVTAADVLRVAQDIFRNEKLNMAIIGPHTNDKQLIRSLFL